MNAPSPLQKLGRRIRRLREAAGLALETLADAADMAAPDLAAVEAGRRDAGYLALVRVARALGRPVGDLLAAMDEED